MGFSLPLRQTPASTQPVPVVPSCLLFSPIPGFWRLQHSSQAICARSHLLTCSQAVQVMEAALEDWLTSGVKGLNQFCVQKLQACLLAASACLIWFLVLSCRTRFRSTCRHRLLAPLACIVEQGGGGCCINGSSLAASSEEQQQSCPLWLTKPQTERHAARLHEARKSFPRHVSCVSDSRACVQRHACLQEQVRAQNSISATGNFLQPTMSNASSHPPRSQGSRWSS